MPDGPAAAPPGGESGPQKRRPGWLRPVALGMVGAVVGVAAYALVVDPGRDEQVAPPPPPPTTTTVGVARAGEVYQTILPSLVSVSAQGADPAGGGTGSGVVVSDAGLIMTAHHVVRNAVRIEVTFADGTRSPARIAEADPTNDIAVLEPLRRPTVIVPAVLGGTAQIGDEVYPVGNPLGFERTLTAGVVSGLGRSIARDDGEGTLDGLIQFDAAVNPGSSGGPLLNRDAQVIGIVTALANPTEQRTFIGLGFAVPIGTAAAAAGGIDR